MVSEKSDSVARAAKQIYDEQLRTSLEAAHMNEFVAIEPESESYYLGQTFIEAALEAKRAHPDRRPFVLRIGREAAFHIGASSK